MKYIKQIVSREVGKVLTTIYSVDFTVIELPEDTSVII